MWEPLHAFTFDADAHDVFIHILGPQRQRPWRIVLTNHAYWFICEFQPTTHGAALYAVALHARLYAAKAGSKPGQMGRAPWDKRLMLRGRADPTPVAEGEVGWIVLLQRRPGHCRATLYLAQEWKSQKWQYEDSRGELVDMTGTMFLVAIWRGLLEEWIEGRRNESDDDPRGDWSPNAEEIAVLREVIEERLARAQEARGQGAAASKPGQTGRDDTAAIRSELNAWVERQTKEHAPPRAKRSAGRTPDIDDDWAYGQLMQGRGMYEVYQEWLKRIPPERLERLSEPYDAFKKAMRRRKLKDSNANHPATEMVRD